MVDIREDANESEGGGRPRQTPDPQPPPNTNNSGLIGFLRGKPVDTVLWVLRLLTLIFALMYAFPLGGLHTQVSSYSRTLLACAATNALRLHQRLGGFRLSREFFASMFLEDSCHYLFYSVLYLGCFPVTMPLLPIFLFALLHWSSFSLQMLNTAGLSGSMPWRLLSKLVEGYSQNLLTVIACTEIFLMPMCIVLTFMGRVNLLFPFIYYRFLTLRYMSRRNPNTRVAFRQMRLALEESVNRPGCPPIIRSGANRFVGLIERLSPSQPA